MANIAINGGETYFWAKSQGSSTAFIMDSTDHSHNQKKFGNSILIDPAATSNANNRHLSIVTPKAAGHVYLRRSNGVASSTPWIIISATGASNSGDSAASIQFTSRTSYRFGIYQNATTALCDFQFSNSTALSASPRTSISVAMVFSPAEEVFIPNLDAAAGTFPVEYNTTTREITYDNSTLRSKKNITDAPANLFDKVLELQPREFERKNSKSDNITNTGKFIGLIAEEAASIHNQFAKYTPNFDYDENGKLSEKVVTDALVPGNIDWPAVTTSLIGKIKQLESRLQQLESQ